MTLKMDDKHEIANLIKEMVRRHEIAWECGENEIYVEEIVDEVLSEKGFEDVTMIDENGDIVDIVDFFGVRVAPVLLDLKKN